MDTLLSLAIGLGLSAACGFRIFVPLLGMSIASMSGHLHLVPGFEWIGTWPALIAFSTATVLEVGAYYIPWLDNFIDMLGAPVAVVAGAIATASVVGDLSPFLKWSLAVIAGGGAAGLLHTGTAAARALSSGTTGGVGNALISTAELSGSILTTFLAIALPMVAVALVIIICWWAVKKIIRFRTNRRNGIGGKEGQAPGPIC